MSYGAGLVEISDLLQIIGAYPKLQQKNTQRKRKVDTESDSEEETNFKKVSVYQNSAKSIIYNLLTLKHQLKIFDRTQKIKYRATDYMLFGIILQSKDIYVLIFPRTFASRIIKLFIAKTTWIFL